MKPGFFAFAPTNIVNATGDGTVYEIPFASTTFNQGSGYNTSTGIFHAPVSGIYMLSAGAGTVGTPSNCSEAWSCFRMNTSYANPETYLFRENIGLVAATNSGKFFACNTIIVPLDATDAVSVCMYALTDPSTKNVTIIDTSFFSGYLLEAF